MNILEHQPIDTDMEENHVQDAVEAHAETPRRSSGRLLLAGGALGLVGVAFIFAAPELGLASALGGVVASVGSAGMTLLARK